MKTPVLKINKKELINWYFNTNEDSLYLMERVIDDLKKYGSFRMYVEDIFDLAGYLPLFIVKNKEDVYEADLEAEEIQQIDAYDYEFI